MRESWRMTHQEYESHIMWTQLKSCTHLMVFHINFVSNAPSRDRGFYLLEARIFWNFLKEIISISKFILFESHRTNLCNNNWGYWETSERTNPEKIYRVYPSRILNTYPIGYFEYQFWFISVLLFKISLPIRTGVCRWLTKWVKSVCSV